MKRKQKERSIKLLSKSERNKILNSIKDRFGVKPDLKSLLKKDNRLYLYTGEGLKIEPEIAGLSVGEIKGGEFKPNIEGSQIINPEKNVYNITQGTALEWMQGKDIAADKNENLTAGFVVVKCEDDLLGSGKFNGKIIKNGIPKNRRLKFK